MKTVAEVKGLEGVLSLLNKLPPELVSKRGGVVLSGLRKGANVMRKAWREEVQRLISEPNIGPDYIATGTYQKAISTSRLRKPKEVGGDEAVRVRVKAAPYPETGNGKPKNAAMVAGILEHGTEHMEAKAPMRKAFEASSQKALDAVVKATNDGIAKAIKKLDKTA